MKFILSDKQAQSILDYLTKRPYVEVYELINIFSQLEKVKEKKQEKDKKEK